MTAFKKTILGKILAGASKVVKPLAIIAGSALGLGALSGVVKGIGAVAGISKEVKGIDSVISKVSQSAVNLVTGTTADERDQVKEVTAEAKAAQDKLDQVQRLIDAGATRAKAEQMVGITAAELGSANSDIKDAETQTKLTAQNLAGTVTTAGPGCMIVAFTLLLKGAIIGTFICNLIFN